MWAVQLDAIFHVAEEDPTGCAAVTVIDKGGQVECVDPGGISESQKGVRAYSLFVREGVDRDVAVAALRFVRSPYAARILASSRREGTSLAEALAALPVALPNTETREVLSNIESASATLSVWQREALVAEEQLLAGDSVVDALRDARRQALRLRQKIAAARLVDEVDSRIVLTYPAPIALGWLGQASRGGSAIEEYLTVLRNAENVTAYLATLVYVTVRGGGVRLDTVSSMASRFAQGRGPTFGDWFGILCEANGGGVRGQLHGDLIVREAVEVLDAPEVRRSIMSLVAKRNDQAHNRGPQGMDLPIALDGARRDLDQIMEAAEFVAEYPLRIVERADHDIFRNLTRYEYRTLMGWRHEAGSATAEYDGQLEGGSLYLLGRDKVLHLLRPFYYWLRCQICGNQTIFVPDHWDGNVLHVRAQDHGHTVPLEDQFAALAHVGLVTGAN